MCIRQALQHGYDGAVNMIASLDIIFGLTLSGLRMIVR